MIEAVGGGTDTVKTGVSYTLAAGQEIETLRTTSDAGTAAIRLTGNAFDNKLERSPIDLNRLGFLLRR